MVIYRVPKSLESRKAKISFFQVGRFSTVRSGRNKINDIKKLYIGKVVF